MFKKEFFPLNFRIPVQNLLGLIYFIQDTSCHFKNYYFKLKLGDNYKNKNFGEYLGAH